MPSHHYDTTPPGFTDAERLAMHKGDPKHYAWRPGDPVSDTKTAWTPPQVEETRRWWQDVLMGRKPKRKETGEENARRFVQVVEKLARERRLIVCRMDGGLRGVKDETCNWQWMPNAGWRSRVITLLDANRVVTYCKFTPPDSFDGWTFRADSMVPTPRVALLTLDDTL